MIMCLLSNHYLALWAGVCKFQVNLIIIEFYINFNKINLVPFSRVLELVYAY